MKYALTLLFALLGAQAAAQDVRYVSDQLHVTLRSGQGAEYRILHRGLPSGTRLVLGEENEVTGYSLVTTPDGIEGWVRSQYLAREKPARQQLRDALERENLLIQNGQELRQQYVALTASNTKLSEQLNAARAQLAEASSDLARIRETSGDIVALDASHRQLEAVVKTLRARVGVLQVDNLRLQEKREKEAFIYGALAVLAGVAVVMLVPKLWNLRRRRSGWA